MKIVQVTSEAKASPIITALTTMSADLNIVHGDNSREFGGGGLQQFAFALARRGSGVCGRCGRAAAPPGRARLGACEAAGAC